MNVVLNVVFFVVFIERIFSDLGFSDKKVQKDNKNNVSLKMVELNTNTRMNSNRRNRMYLALVNPACMHLL